MALSNIHAAELRRYCDELAHLKGLGFVVPAAIDDAAASHARLVKAKKATPSKQDLRDDAVAALIAGADSVPAKSLQAILAVEEQVLILASAVDAAAAQHLSACRAARGEIFAAARDLLYTPAVEALLDVVGRTATDDTVDGLLRRGKDEEARALALAPEHYAALQRAYKIRSLLLPANGKSPASREWASWPYTGAPTNLDAWLDFVRDGAEPWFPTGAEHAAEEQRIRDEAATHSRTARGGVISGSMVSGRPTYANEAGGGTETSADFLKPSFSPAVVEG